MCSFCISFFFFWSNTGAFCIQTHVENSFGTDCKNLFLIELWDLSHTLKVYYQSQSLQWPRDELATVPGCNFAFTPRLLGHTPAPPPPKSPHAISHAPQKLHFWRSGSGLCLGDQQIHRSWVPGSDGISATGLRLSPAPCPARSAAWPTACLTLSAGDWNALSRMTTINCVQGPSVQL